MNPINIWSGEVFGHQTQMCGHEWSRPLIYWNQWPISWHQSCFLSSSLALFFLPFKSFLLPFICLPMMLWLTGGGCSRQMLKCLVWSGFTRRRATRDSPMNSLCVSLSSSHTDTLGLKEGRERGVAGRKRRAWIKYAGLGFGDGF